MNSLRDMMLYVGAAASIALLVLIPLMMSTAEKHEEFEKSFLKNQVVEEVAPFRATTFTPPKNAEVDKKLLGSNADNSNGFQNTEP